VSTSPGSVGATGARGTQLLESRITLGRRLRPRDLAFRVYLVGLFGPPAVVLAAQLVDTAAAVLGVTLPVADLAAAHVLRTLAAALAAAATLLWLHTAA
jgi:hypothetical protein